MNDRYTKAGVNVSEANEGIQRIFKNIASTWPSSGFGAIKLGIGYFANVLDFGGIGLAMTTDGVGSKTKIAEMVGDYSTIGIDCVAMNVNDLICVGATPTSMLDYIGVETVDAKILEEISIGLAEGAKQARISISGGEISQLPDSIKGFDLVGAAVGRVDLDKIIVGADVISGDALIGFKSNGIHANGLTLARRVLFDEAKLDYNESYDLDCSLGYELLKPTKIYVQEVLDLLDNIPVKALVNITGDGLLNLKRIHAENIGFAIDRLPPVPEIFKMIQKYGAIDTGTMFETFNMGIGFCVVVSPEYADDVISIVKRHGCTATVIGSAIRDKYKSVQIWDRPFVGRRPPEHHFP